MKGEMALLTEIVFEIILHAIPFISNTYNDNNSAILLIHEHNAAFSLDVSSAFSIQHPVERNFVE